MKSRRRQRGFTLIEVVVAFAILALSLGALYETFGGSLRRASTANQRELAALRAEALLSEFRGSGGLAPQPRSGRDANGYEWRITSKPYPAELAERSSWVAEAVTVQVSWGKSATRSIQLETVELLRREGL